MCAGGVASSRGICSPCWPSHAVFLAREVFWPGLAGAGGQSPLHLVRVELEENHSPAYDRAVFRLGSSSPNVEGTWGPGNAGCPLPWAGTVKAPPRGGGGCLWAGSPCALVRVSLPGRCTRPPLPMSLWRALYSAVPASPLCPLTQPLCQGHPLFTGCISEALEYFTFLDWLLKGRLKTTFETI